MQMLLPVAEEQMRTGLRQVSLAGRFQVLGTAPLVIADVAHNPHAAEALARSLSRHPCAGRTLAVFSMLADKDIAGVARALGPRIDRWHIARIHHGRAAQVAELVQCVHVEAPHAEVQTYDDLTEAFTQACREAAENERIIVFGSFFTVVEVMQTIA